MHSGCLAGVLDEEVDPQQGVQVWEDEIGDTIYLWWCHPSRALTMAEFDFADELRFMQRFGSSAKYLDASSRWWDAVSYYDSMLKHWQGRLYAKRD